MAKHTYYRNDLLSKRNMFWDTWRLAIEGGIRKQVSIEKFRKSYIDQNCWVQNDNLTMHEFAEIAKKLLSKKLEISQVNHEILERCRRIIKTDLNYPIIIEGKKTFSIIDGCHRLAHAYMLGHATIEAIHYLELPEPHWWKDEKGNIEKCRIDSCILSITEEKA